MIHNLLIIVFFALWTLLFILLILIGYFLEKKYKFAAITPQVKSQTPQNSVILLNNILIPDVQKQSQQKNESQLVEEIINNQRMFSQQNAQENGVKIYIESGQKEASIKQPITKKQRQTITQTIFSRKPILGNFDGIETGQSTNRKSLRSRQSVKETVFLDRVQIKKFLIKPRYILSQVFRQVEIHLLFRIAKFPNQARIIMYLIEFNQKCNLFAKIFYSHKVELSRIFMLSQIYFRQMLCFEICGTLLLYFQQLQYYYIMGSSCGGYFIIKIFDYYIIQSICKNGSGCIIKLISYIIWGCALAILILGIMYKEINNFICLQYYAPALVLELFIVDPIRYFLIKNCLAVPRVIINKKSQTIK